MQKTQIRRLYYRFRYQYLTLNNVVLAVALLVAVSWVWGSIGMMQRNYALEKQLQDSKRQEQLAQLEIATLQFQQKYYQSTEYQELAAREDLGLANPGEKVFILPPNTPSAINFDKSAAAIAPQATASPSNFSQWMNFLLGENAKDLKQ